MNFYFDAAKTLDRLESKQGSVKSVLSNLPEKDRRRTSALVIETLKHKAVIQEVIGSADLIKQEGKKLKSSNLVLVLVHDLLFSGGIQAGDGPIKQAILRHKTRLRAELQRIKIKRGVKSHNDLVRGSILIPRYIRVNTLKCSTQEAVCALLSRGYARGNPYESEKNFSLDEHIHDLLVLSPNACILEEPFYLSGNFILQDKASCFPAVILSPLPSDDCHVIDATAAPGNKTSLLSAIMANKGKIFAFEKDKRRFTTLLSMLKKAGCKNVESTNLDFLTVDPLDAKYENVTHILVDPSCSGSGIVNRLDHLLETENQEGNEKEADRLERLAAFQISMVTHAMQFPSVQKIVYSTCSIYLTENEHVVRQCLSSDEAKDGRFGLADPSQVLPEWPRRGMSGELNEPGQESSLIRCSPEEDASNGFFVACFTRTPISLQKRKNSVNSSSKKKKRHKN